MGIHTYKLVAKQNGLKKTISSNNANDIKKYIKQWEKNGWGEFKTLTYNETTGRYE